jgi:D-3-phosphoglycerate dehydrogenase
MKIGVIHDYADMFRRSAAYPRLKGHEVKVHTGTDKDPEKLAELLAGCEAAVFTQQRVAFPRAAIERVPALRFISQTGRNAYHIDLEACTERGIVVSAGGVSGPVGDNAGNFASTVELTFAMMMMSMRHLPQEVERFRQGHWQSTVGSRLFGKTLGVYAYGHIGKPVARVGRAFGMKVICWGREGSTARARTDGFDVAPSREAFYESSDVVTLHLPSSKETYGIVTAQDLARMKPTALIVNTSRAPLIDRDTLVGALKKGRPGFAAVDVYEEEPVTGAQHPLLALPNALCVPHLGYNDQEGFERFYEAAVDQLLAYVAGKPVNVINPEALGKAR